MNNILPLDKMSDQMFYGALTMAAHELDEATMQDMCLEAARRLLVSIRKSREMSREEKMAAFIDGMNKGE